VRAKDAAGNYSDWSAIWNVTIDTVDPVSTITSPSDEDFVGGIINVNGIVTETNLLRYYFFIANEGGTNVFGPETVYDDNTADYVWDTTMVPDGRYKIQLEARDKASNKGAASTDSIWVNVVNTVPAVTISTPTEGEFYNSSPI